MTRLNAALPLLAVQAFISGPTQVAAAPSPVGPQVQAVAPSLVVQLGYTQAVSGVAISADGALAVAGSFFGTTRLWHLATGSELRRFDGHTAGVIAAAFSPDGRQVLTGSHDGTARLWDTATGVEVFRFQSELETPRSTVSFSADGRVLVVGSLGGPAQLFDRETGAEILSVQPSVVGAPFAALSPDGLRLVTASMAPGMQVWDTRTGELEVTFGAEAPPPCASRRPRVQWGWDTRFRRPLRRCRAGLEPRDR